MKRKLMMFLALFLMGIGLSVAQTQVRGTVVDESGGPVIGATIQIKGTSQGTVTDMDGNFSLSAPSGGTLVVSYVGMRTQEVPVSANVRVVLETDAEVLEELVVTAMGISRERKALGYASQGVSADNLIQAANTSLSGAMQGKVSGLQITPSSGMPGASSQITIRGARSFSENNTPLYVVDGMPIASTPDQSTENSVTGTDYANRAIDIDPANIESIEVLKGQAAAALYGIRASNGVIVITTKSGKGLAKGKPQVNVSSSVSFDKISRKLEVQQKYAQGSGGVYNPNTSLSWGPLISELPNDPTYGGNTTNTYTQQYGSQPGKYYVPQRAAAGLDPWVVPQAYDNANEYFNTGVTWNNSIRVSQALDKSIYSLFISAANQDGIVPSSGYDRYTANFNAETELTTQWKTGFTGTYVNSTINKIPSANSGLLTTVYGAPPSYDLNGIPGHVEGFPYVQNHFRPSGFENPYWGAENNRFEERNSRFYGNGFINYETRLNSTDKRLNVKYQLGVDAYTTDYLNLWGYGSRNSTSGRGDIEEFSRKNVTVNSLLTANFNWTISSDWNLNVIAGNEFNHERKDYLYAWGNLFNFPDWNHIGNATKFSNRSNVRSKRSIGFFGEVSAAYKSMLYLGVTGRNDMVSHMPRNERSFFYPSVNGSFVFTELDALKGNSILDFGKLRASYAEVGQPGDYVDSYYYRPTFSGGFYTFTPLLYPLNGVSPFVQYPILYDPNLKNQNTRSFEIGADVTFLNNLFDLSYTFSNQNVKDQIFEIPLAGSTGFNSMISNGGKIETKTHEISLNVNPVRTNRVDWSVGVNWTKIDNQVKELAPGVESIFLGGFVTPQVRAEKGASFPVIYGTDYARDSNGNILVHESGQYAGMPKSGETKVIGEVSPDFIMGFNTSLRIEKLKIAAVFEWKAGGQMYHGTAGVLGSYGVRKDTENRSQSFIFDGYKSDGSKNDIEITPERMETYYNYVNNIHASSVFDTDFLKLRELALSYPVYKSRTSNLEVGVNAFARNILLWTKLDYFDPETSQGNTNMSGGFERFSVPSTSSYGFGVNVQF